MSDDIRTTEPPTIRTHWNKGKLTGPKPPLKVREIWAIRIRLQLAERLRDLALFNLAIDSKLRGCDLVALRLRKLCLRQARLQARFGHFVRRPARYPHCADVLREVEARLAMLAATGHGSTIDMSQRNLPAVEYRQLRLALAPGRMSAVSTAAGWGSLGLVSSARGTVMTRPVRSKPASSTATGSDQGAAGSITVSIEAEWSFAPRRSLAPPACFPPLVSGQGAFFPGACRWPAAATRPRALR